MVGSALSHFADEIFCSHFLCSEGREPFLFTFGFARLPNLKEVNIVVHFSPSGMCWVHAALPTITPVISMCLSILRLEYCPPCSIPGYLLERLDNDFQLIKGEVARIDREFAGFRGSRWVVFVLIPRFSKARQRCYC